jgi:hypothetical protein
LRIEDGLVSEGKTERIVVSRHSHAQVIVVLIELQPCILRFFNIDCKFVNLTDMGDEHLQTGEIPCRKDHVIEDVLAGVEGFDVSGLDDEEVGIVYQESKLFNILHWQIPLQPDFGVEITETLWS